MTTHPNMNDLFGLLDKWRHFPAFPLEPRSEVLFALFLPTIMETCIGVKINPLVIPQFPLKKEGNNQSNNVDFFALSEDGKCGYLIELKTDISSVSEKQKCYLKKARRKGMRAILDEFKTIFEATYEKKYARQKYFHLAQALSELCLIESQSTLQDAMYPDSSERVDRPRVKELINKIRILKTPCDLDVVYIQPREPKKSDKAGNGFKYIHFDAFAENIKKHGDLGAMFACYLRKWKEDPAKHPPSETSDCYC